MSTGGATANNTNKKVIFQNYSPFTNCISKIDKTKIDCAKDIDIVMQMYNLIEYSDNYPKRYGILWQHFKDIHAVNNNGNIINFNGDSFNFKAKIKSRSGDNREIENVEIKAPLKYLSAIFGELMK